MGTDLIIISNHAINYSPFDFDQLGQEIAARLNQTRLENQDLYWLTQLDRPGSKLTSQQEESRPLQPWRLRDDEHFRADFYATGWTRGQLSFSGPFDWSIEVYPGKVDYSLWHYRYWGWVQRDRRHILTELREAYRKVLALVVRSLGGTEVTYLADNAHPLASFCEADNYDLMRQKLEQKLGPLLNDFAAMEGWQEVVDDQAHDRAYLVDNFQNLDVIASARFT